MRHPNGASQHLQTCERAFDLRRCAAALLPRACRGKNKKDLALESPMNAFAAIAFASLSSRLGYQMARSPVLPAFAAIGALPEFIGVIVANSPVTRIFKLPSGARLLDVLGALLFAVPPFVANPFCNRITTVKRFYFRYG
jgi:hypothetical protein